MKRFFLILAFVLISLAITIVPAFAIQSGFYDGQAMVHLLGAQYQYILAGIGDDAIILFDTRDMYWYDNLGSNFDSDETSFVRPDAYIKTELVADNDLIYNDTTLYIDDTDFPSDQTIASLIMTSDRFILRPDARLGLHINPVIADSGDPIVYPSDTVPAQITFYALTVEGDIVSETVTHDNLQVGATYDLTPYFDELFSDHSIQYYWIEYEGENVVPSFVQDLTIVGEVPVSFVVPVNDPTHLSYPISYDNFDLLSWISKAVDGFLRTPLFILGSYEVTIGTILAVGISVPIFVAFLRRYAGG